MRRLFKDIKLEQEFREKGYVIVPFLGQEEVEKMKKTYFDLLPQHKGDITPQDEGHNSNEDLTYDFTFTNKSTEYKRVCFEKIVEVFMPKANQILDHYTPIIANFIRKKTGNGEVPLHQNWAFADEKKCTTVSVWCPLVDSTRANGALQIIPGSHKKFGEIRGPMIPWELHKIQQKIVESDLWDYMSIEAGHAVILDDGVIHYSAPNSTEGLRLAIQLILLPEEEPSIHYHLNPEKDKNLIEVLEVDQEFYMNFNPWKKPSEKIKIVDSFHYDPVSLSFQDFKNRLTGPHYDKEGEMYLFTEYSGVKVSREPLFSDSDLEKEFEENGFVKLPALDAAAVNELKSLYQQQGFKDRQGYGFHISMDHDDKEKVGAVMDRIFDIVVVKISHHFVNPKPYICSYVIKEPNPLGLVPSHQDWTFVDDEERHTSATVWIPLVDTSMENGALGVIRGSHRFARNRRPSPSPAVKNPLDPYMFQIIPYHEIIELKAGEALVFDNRTFHTSPPNTTNETRLAVGLGFTQKEANLVHYYLDPITKDRIHKYQVDEAFFRKYDNATLTRLFNQGELIKDYKKLGEYPYRPLKFDPDKLLDQVKRSGNNHNKELTDRLAKLFNYNPDGTRRDVREMSTLESSDKQMNAGPSDPGVPFWKMYTPANIIREIRHRITGR